MKLDWQPQGGMNRADVCTARPNKSIRVEIWTCSEGYRVKIYWTHILLHEEPFPIREAGGQNLARLSADKVFHDFALRLASDFSVQE